MNSLFPWAILYYTCQLGPCHCNVSVADRSVLEKKSAVVQRLFQWVGIWCVHTLRSLVRHHAGAVGPTQGAGLWLSAASLAEAGLRVLEKKSAVVQRLFQWVGIWCVYTHDIALSDTMQGRWDLRRARGCGYRQVRVPGASAGDSSCATAGIEPSTVLDSPSAPKLEPTAGGTTPLTRQHRGRPAICPKPPLLHNEELLAQDALAQGQAWWHELAASPWRHHRYCKQSKRLPLRQAVVRGTCTET